MIEDAADAASPTLGEQTYEELKALILTGELRPGERLAEADMAQRLGVSRTPLRQALSRLDQEKLVTKRATGGYLVVRLDATAIADLVGLREALDTHAARLAAQVASDADLDRLRACIAELESVAGHVDAQEVAAEYDLGLRIHLVIAEATGNAALLDAVKQVYDRLQLAIWLEVSWADHLIDRLSEHRQIVDAICRRDPDAAAEAARAHVQRSLQNMLQVLKLREQRAGRPRTRATR
ncbi:GntR family transcriptional regulator [Azorhizobium oxalatiphilum]|uniref:GntR family transcriptional regulator n=1 Tax=Azorhizobium oxalatiphilum TaxID=980631 RepID=A0A917CEB4_9HYPH|nr:GntR family transcriptional regulator [Azorhizobium oxalatiphilum]